MLAATELCMHTSSEATTVSINCSRCDACSIMLTGEAATQAPTARVPHKHASLLVYCHNLRVIVV